jgi:penicillin amidase
MVTSDITRPAWCRLENRATAVVPYDGSTDAGEWVSYIPIAKLPQLYDPPSGIIVTANQRIVGSITPTS